MYSNVSELVVSSPHAVSIVDDLAGKEVLFASLQLLEAWWPSTAFPTEKSLPWSSKSAETLEDEI